MWNGTPSRRPARATQTSAEFSCSSTRSTAVSSATPLVSTRPLNPEHTIGAAGFHTDSVVRLAAGLTGGVGRPPPICMDAYSQYIGDKA
eukprot:14928031-Heterocapsa_arctica.AAC.1